jgi:hypothetical protein
MLKLTFKKYNQMKIFKQITLFFAALILLTNCSKDEAAPAASTIVGKWKANNVTGTSTVLTQSVDRARDLTSSNYVYDFKADGSFTATGFYDVISTRPSDNAIAGTYKITGTNLALTYMNTRKLSVTESYTLTLTDKSMSLKMNLDDYKKLVMASGDPNAALAISIVTALDVSVNFTKQ